MKSINKAQLISYLGTDPMMKSCSDGNSIVIMPVATHTLNRKTRKRITTWHQVQIRDHQRVDEAMHELTRGSHVMIEGNICYQRYVNFSGLFRTVIRIHAYRYVNLDREKNFL